MDQSVTRQSLTSALVDLLEARGVNDPADAVEVISSPGNGVRLFVIVTAQRAREPLGDELMRVTGHRKPTAGDLWILDEEQCWLLIQHVASLPRLDVRLT